MNNEPWKWSILLKWWNDQNHDRMKRLATFQFMTNIPDVLVIDILSFIGIDIISTASLTCKRFQRLTPLIPHHLNCLSRSSFVRQVNRVPKGMVKSLCIT